MDNLDPKHYRWNDMPGEQLSEQLARRVITTERVMLAQFTLRKGCLVPLHSHESEQITHVLSGGLRFWLGEPPGAPIDVRAGEVLHIPSGVPHQVLALEDTTETDVFSPPRQDWLDRTDTYLRSAAPPVEPWLAPEMQRQAVCLARSFQHWTGRPLVEPGNALQVAARLFEHPSAILSLADGPTYNYGNRRAMELFERDWDQIRSMIGDESAEPHLREERRQALGEALRAGFITNYAGVRVSSRGQRRRIEDGILFALLDEAGERCGVGAVVPTWRDL